MTHPQTVWHYTLGIYIDQILADGEIRLSVDGHRADRPNERTIAWFSADQNWEKTSTKNLTENGIRKALSKSELEQIGNGLYRIGVSTNDSLVKPWMRLKKLARLTDRTIQVLEDSAEAIGANPFDWWGALVPVRSNHWTAVEHLSGGLWRQWVPAPSAETGGAA